MSEALLYCMEKQAGNLGDRIAVSHRTASLTYEELNRRVEHVRRLVTEKVPKHSMVFLNVPDMNCRRLGMARGL